MEKNNIGISEGPECKKSGNQIKYFSTLIFLSRLTSTLNIFCTRLPETNRHKLLVVKVVTVLSADSCVV